MVRDIMSNKKIGAVASLVLAVTFIACSKEEPAHTADAKASAAPAATSAPAPASASAPAPSASAAALPPSPDCPKGSTGPGTFDQPCLAKGAAVRMMEATWTGKTDEKGPFFKLTNKASSVILYGKVTTYFYDKAGKQLEVKDSSGKTHPSQGCGGNIFGGVMKAGEKATVQFSCVKKEHVPEGTAAIEAEIPVVGFADSTEKKSSLYWKNEDLVPEARKKGGAK